MGVIKAATDIVSINTMRFAVADLQMRTTAPTKESAPATHYLSST
jgi:hypothetical protein